MISNDYSIFNEYSYSPVTATKLSQPIRDIFGGRKVTQIEESPLQLQSLSHRTFMAIIIFGLPFIAIVSACALIHKYRIEKKHLKEQAEAKHPKLEKESHSEPTSEAKLEIESGLKEEEKHKEVYLHYNLMQTLKSDSQPDLATKLASIQHNMRTQFFESVQSYHEDRVDMYESLYYYPGFNKNTEIQEFQSYLATPEIYAYLINSLIKKDQPLYLPDLDMSKPLFIFEFNGISAQGGGTGGMNNYHLILWHEWIRSQPFHCEAVFCNDEPAYYIFPLTEEKEAILFLDSLYRFSSTSFIVQLIERLKKEKSIPLGDWENFGCYTFNNQQITSKTAAKNLIEFNLKELGHNQLKITIKKVNSHSDQLAHLILPKLFSEAGKVIDIKSEKKTVTVHQNDTEKSINQITYSIILQPFK